MDKTISINLGGTFFQISEEAYEKLAIYLEILKKHFSNTEGGEEILSDIEFRIAEIFQTKINDSHNLIVTEDVEEAIGILGKPEDFGTADKQEEDKQHKNYKDPRRLYRDEDGKLLGGVCNGLGHFLNVDPIWFRIVFVISLFFAGTGILIYLILWIIIPAARTTEEKLRMKGPSLTINEIEEQVKSEFEDLKQRFKGMKSDARTQTRKEYRDMKSEWRSKQRQRAKKYQRRSVSADLRPDGGSYRRHSVGSVIGEILHYLVRALLIMVGIVLLFLATVLTMSLVLSLLAPDTFLIFTQWGITSISLPALFSMILETPVMKYLALLSLGLLVGIPLLMLVYNSIRIILGFRRRIRLVSMVASLLWLTGLVIGIVITIHIIGNFHENNKVVKIYPISVQPKTLYLDLIQKQDSSCADGFEDSYEPSGILANCFMDVNEVGKKQFCGYPTFRTVVSENGKFEVKITRMSRGSNRYAAYMNAANIQYRAFVADSTIYFDEKFVMDKPVWRNQQVKITISVPEGKQLFISPNMRRLLANVQHDSSNNLDEDMIEKNLRYVDQEWIPVVDSIYL